MHPDSDRAGLQPAVDGIQEQRKKLLESNPAYEMEDRDRRFHSVSLGCVPRQKGI